MATLFQITNAHKRYGDQVLLDGADATLGDSTKVGFVGRNGAGKSTLLRVLLGEEELDGGEVVRHPALRLGYLRQHDAATALAQFQAPAPIDWKRTLPAWRAVYAAALLGTDRNEEAREIIATIRRDRLNPQERELIEPLEK